jgi:hypothetical protein
MIDFKCPFCGKEIHVKDSAAGMKGQCKQCGKTIKVPDGPPAAAERAEDFFQLVDAAEKVAPVPPPLPKRAPSGSKPLPLAERQDDVTPNERIALIGGTAGLALLALSTFLPWMKTFLGRSLGVFIPTGQVTFGLSAVAGAAVWYAYTQKKYWLESLLAASAWGTLATLWSGSLLVQLLRVPAMFSDMVSAGFGLYIAPVAAVVAAGALGYVAFRQVSALEPQRRKWLLIGSQGAAVLVGLVFGGFFSPVTYSASPRIEVTENVPAVSGGMPVVPDGVNPFAQGKTFPGGAKAIPDEVNPFARNGKPFPGGNSVTRKGPPIPHDPAHVVPDLNDPANPFAGAIAAKMRAIKQTEIEKLEKKQADANQAKEQLKQFQVMEARALLQKKGTRKQWVREVVVKNGTEQAVSHAYFRGTLQSPGRATPVLTDTFNHKVKGGLEPGEQVTWKINVSRSSAWKDVEENPDMTYTVEVVRLDGSDGKPLLKNDFSDDDQKRLDVLKKELAETK